MSAPIKMAIGAMVEGLIRHLMEVRPIVEADQLTEEGLNKIREEKVFISGSLERIEGKNREWDDYIRGVGEETRNEESEAYTLFRHQNKHFYEWVEEGREMVNKINIKLANEDNESLVESVRVINLGVKEEEKQEDRGVHQRIEGARGIRTMRTRGNEGVNFPKTPWPHFDGDPLLWPGFWQQFRANVEDKDIPDVQKCSYLLMSLKGKAERAVKGYLATGENYLLILNTLKRQFGDIKVIKESLQNELLNLPVANESVGSLRSCFEELERICRQLQNTGLQEGEDGEFMLMTVKNKFPRAVVLEMLKKERELKDKWSLREWRENLNELITLREEAVRCTRSLSLGTNPFVQRRPESNYRNNGIKPGFSKYSGEVRRVFSIQEKGRRESNQRTGPVPKCFLCGKVHWAANCRQVVGRESRLRIINEQGRCHKCLRKGHTKDQCSGKGCMICNQDHHKAICLRGQIPPRTGANMMELGNRMQMRQTRTNAEISKGTTMAVTGVQGVQRKEVLLMSTKVRVFAGLSSQRSITALVFFDCGSQTSFITDELIKKLSPPRVGEGYLDLLAVRQREPTRINSPKYFVKLELNTGEKEGLIVNRIDHVTGNIKRVDINSGETQLLAEKPDILIGMAEFWKFFKKVSPVAENLFQVDTTVGPIICGQLERSLGGSPIDVFTAAAVKETQEEEGSNQFWSLETIGVRDNPEEKDDEVAQKMFNDSVQRREGRYVVSWPWRSPKEELPTNFSLAYRRLVSLLEKVRIAPNQLNSLDVLFKENIREKIVEESEIKGYGEHFLPHHCVFAPGKKPRVVYDGSAKVRGGKCLNDMLFRGPIEMPQLPGLIIRSRVPRIVLWGDIQRAFWTLELKEEDRNYVKFLWVRDVKKPITQQNLLVLRFRRVPFGVISSPFLLGATVKHHLKQKRSDLAEEVERNIFVDNVFVGSKSEKEAMEKYGLMKKLFTEARMNLREFISNSEGVNNQIPEEDRLGKEKPKVMGIRWDTKLDEYSLEFPQVESAKITRRKVLKDLNSMFDPCGWAAPCLLPAKLFFQSLWESDRKWDDKLDEKQGEEWDRITEGWKSVSFQLKRRITLDKMEEIQLHVFVDASKYAYATCVYLRIEGKEVKICLLYSRSRLKPKKLNISIPRMELLGVLIGSRAIKFVEDELGIEVNEKILWCDSKPVLSWVRSKEDQPRFVMNRLEEIRKKTGLELRYIPTEDNPADVASRGCTPEELKTHKLWWTGPRWLKDSKNSWPDEMSYKITQQPEESREPEIAVVVNTEEIQKEWIEFEKFKKWDKLVKIMSRVMKGTQIWMRKINREPESDIKKISKGKYITPDDFELAEKLTLRIGQIRWEGYAKKNNQIKWEKDEDGLIRLKTRIGKSDTPKLFHAPIAFPKGAPILEILIYKAHEKVMHERVDATLNNFLGEFWAPGVRNLVKKVLKQCVNCRKNRGPPYALPEMPSHPEERVKRSLPFEYTALDYLGPSIIKETKNRGKTGKYWIVLITCLTTRGVYLEPVFDLTAESFLHVLRRFASRRGKPKCIISDNAQTFKLAAKVGEMYDAKEKFGKGDRKLEEYLTKGKIGWKFIPALSPWENGCAERLVKICKDAFKSALGRIILTPEELRTFTAEVESILNSRPITHISTEPDGERALRPIDFINPGAELGIPVPDTGEDDNDKDYRMGQISLEEKLKERWKRTNKVLNIFWERWNREYLIILRNRNQWTHKGPRSQESGEPRIGEVVMVEEEFRPRNVWPMGRIIKLNGNPGAIRSVKVKMLSGRIVDRPVNKLYPLEASQKGSIENKGKEKIEMKGGEQEKGIDKKRDEIKHPMMTRAQSRAQKSIISLANLILIGMFINFVKCSERENFEKLKSCGDCEIKCDPLGIIMKTPDRMEKMEICCMGNCFTHRFAGRLQFQLPKENLVVGHDCIITYSSRRRTLYRNKIICPPVGKCELIDILSWDMILNPECWTKWMGIIYGSIISGSLIAIICVFSCLKSFGKIIQCIGSCIWLPIKFCKIISGKGKTPRHEEMELNLLEERQERSSQEREWQKRKRNRRLEKLSLGTRVNSLILSLIILLQTGKVHSGAEVAVIQATSEDCIQESNGTVCHIRGAAQVTILPAGQEISLALKNKKGQTAGSLTLRMKALTLHCNQETIAWLRSYQTKVKSARRCPTMGTCKKGRCANIRPSEKVKELEGFWDYPSKSYCMEGESIWGSKCGLPSVGINECFFYKIIAVPVTLTAWKQIRCTGWDYEIKTEVVLKMGNESEKTELILYPGITENWGEVSLTPTAVTPPIAPVLDDYFITSDREAIFAGKEVKTQLKCKDEKRAAKFECELGTEACKECWINGTGHEEELINCECADFIPEKLEPKLPFTTDKLNMRVEKGRILSETKYTPVELLIRIEKLKIVAEIEGNKCKAKMLGKLKGCYDCATGGQLNYTCWTDWGEAIAEIHCPKNLIFLAKCRKEGENQVDILPFDKSRIDTTCEVICPGGKSKLKIEGDLMYIPVKEREYKTRYSEELVTEEGFGLKFEDLWEIDWKNIFNPFREWQNIAITSGTLFLLFCVIYFFWRLTPFFMGYRFILGIAILERMTHESAMAAGGMLLMSSSIEKDAKCRDRYGGVKEAPFSHKQFIPNLKMSDNKKLINFASEILNCDPKEVGAPLQFATNQRRVERAINITLNRGATLRYELDDKQFEQLNGNKLVVVEDRPFWGVRPAVSHRRFAIQVLRLRRTPGSCLGPMVMTGDRFYPLGGLEFTNFRDEYDDFGEFTKWLEEWEGQAQVKAYEVRGGVGSVREGTGQSVDFEVEMGPTKLRAKCSENGKGHEFSGQIGPSGQISIKVKGKGTFEGCLTLLGIFWMAANMAQAMNQPRVKAGDVSSEEEFDFELQQWESELSGDLINHPERVENMEEGQGPVERLENGTGNVPGQGVGAVPQGRGLIGSTTGQEATVRTCESGIVARAVANQLSGATMGFRLDANWAEVHKSIPPPTILFPGPQGMRTAVVIPLEQRPSTSTAVIREDGPSSSGMGDEQHTGGERARWDGRTRHPQGRQNVRGEAAWPYERPERYGARLRPIRSRQHEQPREEATDVPTNPPRLRMPQGAPPLTNSSRHAQAVHPPLESRERACVRICPPHCAMESRLVARTAQSGDVLLVSARSSAR